MKKVLSGCLLLVLIWAMSCKKNTPPPPGPTPVDSVPANQESAYLTKARQTHSFIMSQLLSPYYSYRVNTTTNTNSAFEWYNASQIYADAAMVEVGDSSYLAPMKRTFQWMEHMWDAADPYGGYFAFANLDGSGSSGTRYVDDNSLTGVVYLQAYDLCTGADKQAYLDKAKACANWITNSGLWDQSFGGGFWWSTDMKYKPTQTNAVALQLFLKLYKVTSDTSYLNWANKVNNWLTTKMQDPSTGLFIWQYDNTGVRYSQIFTYDNAIMLEDYLLYSQVLNDPSYLAKAQAQAAAMNQTLWDAAHNVYIFNTADRRINPAWCGWASEAMIRLYEADHNSTWLSYAKGNIDAINVVLQDPASHGYYQFAALDGAGRYTNMEGVDQAWMQRVEALLSKYR